MEEVKGLAIYEFQQYTEYCIYKIGIYTYILWTLLK